MNDERMMQAFGERRLRRALRATPLAIGTLAALLALPASPADAAVTQSGRLVTHTNQDRLPPLPPPRRPKLEWSHTNQDGLPPGGVGWHPPGEELDPGIGSDEWLRRAIEAGPDEGVAVASLQLDPPVAAPEIGADGPLLVPDRLGAGSGAAIPAVGLVPAPGVLGLLALAGLSGRGRRRQR